ncbi:hypothetical protein PROFUN_14706 [Planoprotostelium fungivorum]|uniref:Uncharacterized protein n=1 Tax=Planoprotostelium fungivorum TaxID=1890364 RepID=A0A2P6MZ67_9EUKA|nr:hypothetical protein PROFUN_14706 [Planoprotostelium fungivorum]
MDIEPKKWDDNPKHVEAAERAYQAIQSSIPLSSASQWNVLEIGCGTGLLSMRLSPRVKNILGVDPSSQMISAFNKKKEQYSNIDGVEVLLEREDQLPQDQRRFDFVASHLVFHHIPNMYGTIHLSHTLLHPGGHIAISDFQKTTHSELFHPKDKMEGVERHGINVEEMEDLLHKAGFVDVSVKLDKETEEGMMSFPFLLCTGRKA